MSILFWVAKNRTKQGLAPLFARITVDGKRTEHFCQRTVSVSNWDATGQRVISKVREAKEINDHICFTKSKILQAFNALELSGKVITIDTLKNEFLGIKEKPRMLMSIFKQHNADVKKLINKGYAKPTWIKYETTVKHLTSFLQEKYRSTDIDITLLTYAFMADFEFFLKSEKNIGINTTSKYLNNLKKVIKECVTRDWLVKDPFHSYKLKSVQRDRIILSENDLAILTNKTFTIVRLAQVKDIFLFSCYTGLAYIDIFNLKPEHISIGIDGHKWVLTHRQKTKTASRIPLLPPALAILDKYATHDCVTKLGRLLPVNSNQKMNAYLKEIAACCGLQNELTFHIARHTFATTVTLTNGVPIESVSKMLGHKKLQTTQLYAKILDEKVSGDMV